MVNILRRADAPVVDEPAMDEFRRLWHVYAKTVENNSFAHREVTGVLHRVLAEEVGRPFRFLDLACGDARTTVAALQNTPVIHYHGIDLSAPALAMAAETVKGLACPVELEQADFVAAMRDRPEPADVIWIGLSLHHLPTADKGVLMREARAAVGDGGRFLIYEPTRREGEDRPAYLDRFEAAYRPICTALTADEWASVVTHVRTADFPETPSGWMNLGRAAGFADARELYTDPGGCLTVYAFRP